MRRDFHQVLLFEMQELDLYLRSVPGKRHFSVPTALKICDISYVYTYLLIYGICESEKFEYAPLQLRLNADSSQIDTYGLW